MKNECVHLGILCSLTCFQEKGTFYVACFERQKNPINSHIGVSKFIFLQGTQKNYFSRDLCGNIECPNVRVNIFFEFLYHFEICFQIMGSCIYTIVLVTGWEIMLLEGHQISRATTLNGLTGQKS
jgi:hypothetical protein